MRVHFVHSRPPQKYTALTPILQPLPTSTYTIHLARTVQDQLAQSALINQATAIKATTVINAIEMQLMVQLGTVLERVPYALQLELIQIAETVVLLLLD